MFRYEQLPTDQAYRDNFDDIFRKPEKEEVVYVSFDLGTYLLGPYEYNKEDWDRNAKEFSTVTLVHDGKNFRLLGEDEDSGT